MHLVSIEMAGVLMDLSARTILRRIKAGELASESLEGRTMLPMEQIEQYISFEIDNDERAIIKQADDGEAEGQDALGLLFLSHRKYKGAVHWLELAARRGNGDAMHALGGCYLAGNGVERNKEMGVSWIARAAAYGHVIAKAQTQALLGARWSFNNGETR